jgi:(5-formylfuran-3-yl)methyl phosphate synthase
MPTNFQHSYSASRVMPTKSPNFINPCPLRAITPLLLVSVKSAAEASLAREAGVGWIDLKNPDAGPLGAPTHETAFSVAKQLQGFANRSVALGEMRELNRSLTRDLCHHFPVAKVGLAGCGADPNLISKFAELQQSLGDTHLIPVYYADCVDCKAPHAELVIELAQTTSAPYLLIDTYCKDGRRLFDFIDHKRLREVVESARAAKLQTVLAGSLRLGDVPELAALQPAAIGIRGAVCDGRRTKSINAERLQEWVEHFALLNV